MKSVFFLTALWTEDKQQNILLFLLYVSFNDYGLSTWNFLFLPGWTRTNGTARFSWRGWTESKYFLFLIQILVELQKRKGRKKNTKLKSFITILSSINLWQRQYGGERKAAMLKFSSLLGLSILVAVTTFDQVWFTTILLDKNRNWVWNAECHKSRVLFCMGGFLVLFWFYFVMLLLNLDLTKKQTNWCLFLSTGWGWRDRTQRVGWGECTFDLIFILNFFTIITYFECPKCLYCI